MANLQALWPAYSDDPTLKAIGDVLTERLKPDPVEPTPQGQGRSGEWSEADRDLLFRVAVFLASTRVLKPGRGPVPVGSNAGCLLRLGVYLGRLCTAVGLLLGIIFACLWGWRHLAFWFGIPLWLTLVINGLHMRFEGVDAGREADMRRGWIVSDNWPFAQRRDWLRARRAYLRKHDRAAWMPPSLTTSKPKPRRRRAGPA